MLQVTGIDSAECIDKLILIPNMIGAICAKTIRDNFKIDVVVFESEPKVGGRLGSYDRNSVPFTAGASYFTTQGPHMKRYLKDLLSQAAISEWKPRVGMVGKSALTSGEYVGFIPAINTQEEEVNIEAWIEDQPKTGAPRPGGNMRPATAFWNPATNIPIYDLPAPSPLHRRRYSAETSLHRHMLLKSIAHLDLAARLLSAAAVATVVIRPSTTLTGHGFAASHLVQSPKCKAIVIKPI